MLHPIDPTVDYAFKRLLGDPAHADLLIDFLNAILRLDVPIVEVEIRNPFNEREFDLDKLVVVDVKARLADGHSIQVEVQSTNPPRLRERILYGWADLYQDQLAKGQDYTRLNPVSAIWILREILFAEGRWVYFLKEAHGWTTLPPALETPVMRKAMSVLERISDKTEDYWAYQARQNFLRDQETTRVLLEEALDGKAQADALIERLTAEKAQAEAERAQAEAREAQAEAREAQAEAREAQAEERQARFAEALRAAGIDPASVLRDEPDRE